MHRLGCIHGNLKAVRSLSPKSLPAPDIPHESNILVNNDRSAVLANFHSASFLPESGANAGVPASECDPFSVRWHAPEFLFPGEFGLESARHTKETDVYAFGMVMFEVGPTSSFWFSNADHPRVLDHVTHAP